MYQMNLEVLMLGNNFFLHIEEASMETMEIKRGDFSVNIKNSHNSM